jgi:hypothetical protein
MDGLAVTPAFLKKSQESYPVGLVVAFTIGNKNYAVGRVTNSLNGEVVEAFKDNKIKFLHIWLIGALANHPDLLSDIASGRKYKNKPARIKISLRLLSLSSSKKNDIAKILQGTKTFICEGVTFEMVITNSDYLFPEGFGAALEARKTVSPGVKEFHILDLGGGTFDI